MDIIDEIEAGLADIFDGIKKTTTPTKETDNGSQNSDNGKQRRRKPDGTFFSDNTSKEKQKDKSDDAKPDDSKSDDE